MLRTLATLGLAVAALALALGGGSAAGWFLLTHPREPAGWQPAAVAFRPDRPFHLALGPNEGERFEARLSPDGAPLTAACAYRLSGAFPAGRAWTLVAHSLPDNGAELSGLSAPGTLRERGTETITVSAHAAPGNWLRLRPGGRFALVLSVYGSAVGDGSGFADLALPAIETLGCDG